VCVCTCRLKGFLLTNVVLSFFLLQGASWGGSNGSTPATSVPISAPSSLLPETVPQRNFPTMPSRLALGPRPAAPLFPAGAKPSMAGGGGASGKRGSIAQFESFSSFQPSSNAATAAPRRQVADEDDAAAVRRRQAEERTRLIAQLQQEEDEEQLI